MARMSILCQAGCVALLHLTYEKTKAWVRKPSALLKVTPLRMESGISHCSAPETWALSSCSYCFPYTHPGQYLFWRPFHKQVVSILPVAQSNTLVLLTRTLLLPMEETLQGYNWVTVLKTQGLAPSIVRWPEEAVTSMSKNSILVTGLCASAVRGPQIILNLFDDVTREATLRCHSHWHNINAQKEQVWSFLV